MDIKTDILVLSLIRDKYGIFHLWVVCKELSQTKLISDINDACICKKFYKGRVNINSWLVPEINPDIKVIVTSATLLKYYYIKVRCIARSLLYYLTNGIIPYGDNIIIVPSSICIRQYIPNFSNYLFIDMKTKKDKIKKFLL
jgi:hypothetical protein